MNRFHIWYKAQPPALRALLTINVVVYLLWQVLFIHISPTFQFVRDNLALHPDFPAILSQPWQLLTYNFLHLEPGLGGFLHILFNMLWFVWVGREYEFTHGSQRLLSVYVLGGIGGGILTVILHSLFPTVNPFGGMIHGASASVLAMLTMIGVLYPNKSIGLLLLGNFKLIHIVIAFLALDILFLAGGGTAVAAHMGGALTGFLLATGQKRDIDLSGWAAPLFQKRSPQRKEGGSFFERLERRVSGKNKEKTDAPRAKVYEMKRGKAASSSPKPDEVDIDRILDKISESGYDALTDDEKRVLYEASKR